MLGHGEGEQHVAHLLIGGRAPGHDLQVRGRDAGVVAGLHQEPAGHGAERLAPGQGVRQPTRHQQAQVLPVGEDGDGFLIRVGGDHHLGENLDDLVRRGRVQLAVDRHDAAEGRDRVALQGALVGALQVGPQSHAAGVGVLDDRHGRDGGGVELGHQFIGRVGVADVVEAELLALQLAGGGDARPRHARAIEGGRLMRVLAVSHGLGQGPGDGLPLGPSLADLSREPGRDRRIVGRRAGIGPGRQPAAQLQRR